ncbi:MAG: PspC domain-containing protein [Sporomusaceae bacterium]|nr:PspC domain-containing protein [Sporomusaceae bacterium]
MRMVWLFRLGLYLVGGLTAWQALQGGEPAGGMLASRPLALDQANGMVFGVCAGLSQYTGLDVSLIRLLWAVTAFYRGAGIALYILAFLIMPVLLP